MAEKEKKDSVTHAEDTSVSGGERPLSELAKLLAYRERTEMQEDAPVAEQIPEVPKTAAQKVGAWFANFWYHYKWPTIVVAFFVLVLAITIPQLLSRTDSDIQVIYGGPAYLDGDKLAAIEDAFAQVMGVAEDVNKDGKLTAMLMYQTLMTEEQMAAAEANGSIILDRQTLADSKQLNMFLLTGEAIICLLDPAQYEKIESADGFLPLAQMDLGTLPYTPYDDCAIYLKDTAFASFFADAFAPLPADTLLCIRRRTEVSMFQSGKAEVVRHETHVALFQKIIAFSVVE